MTNSKNTNKIVMNQLLTSPPPVFSRIESPLILSALLIGLLILTACGGAAAPTEDITRLEGELRTARTALTEAEDERDTAQTNLTTVTGERNTARTNLGTVTGERDSARTDLSTVTGERDSARTDLSTVTGERDSARTDLSTVTGERDSARTDLSTVTGERDSARTDLGTVTGERNTARGERDGLQTDLNTANTNLNTANTNLNAEKAETTRLNQFIRPTYATWDLFVNPELNPNTTPQNQFLQTTVAVISRAETNAPPQAIQTLNLATTTFDGLALGGEGDDGVAFFRGAIGGTNYNYAGVFEGTDLGRPLTNTAGTTAVWNGSFDHILSDSTDFTLHITFDTNGGTLDAFVHAGLSGADIHNNFRFDNVRFDTRGLITGDVIYGTFAYNNPAATPSATRPATLRGLIGEQGAVGVFVGEVGQDIGGAFVAHPTAALDPNTINFADWAGAAGNPKAMITAGINAGSADTAPLLSGVSSVDDTNPRANFVQGLAIVDDKGFDFAGTAFPLATVEGDVLLLAENSPSGLAYSGVSGTGVTGFRFYAGLLPGTNLGAPITDPNTSVIWDAKIGATLRSGSFTYLYSNPSFKMQVSFNGSTGTINSGTLSGQSFTPGGITVPYTVNGIQAGNANFNIQGRFGSDGLLYGTVNVASTAGTLTGLIGLDGAVGAFVSKDSSSTGDYAGGFVAKPPE